jgi:LysM repeat protein
MGNHFFKSSQTQTISISTTDEISEPLLLKKKTSVNKPQLSPQKTQFTKPSHKSNKKSEVRKKSEQQQHPFMVLHVVTKLDTLIGLSLKYNVSTDEIRKANFMMDDRLTSFRELWIPQDSEQGNVVIVKQEEVQQQQAEGERYQKSLVQLVTHLDESNAGSKAAEYYLAKNQFNLRSALQEAHEDAVWERKNSNLLSAWKAS